MIERAKYQCIARGCDGCTVCKSALSEIEKCEPVYLIVSGADEIVVTKEKYDSWSSAKRISYTSPQPIEKCEPVAWMYQNEETGNIGFIDQWQVDNGFEKNNPRLKIITSLYTSPQPIEKCEPAAEALHERNRLGYAVVDVIGTLDEIIENAQEVEVDDLLHIAIPIDKWHELQDALEEMPKRAELYTSPISKEAYDGAREDLAIWKKRALEAEKKVTQYQ